MLGLVLPIAALLASVALLLTGTGLLTTLVAIRAGAEGFDVRTVGLIMSGYFVGFFLGTFLAPALIRRIGHIRAFAFYSALAAATVLVHPLDVAPVAWFALRLVTGIALVGNCTVIESWLNAQAAPPIRSRVFAIYMVVTLLALAFGQLLLDTQPAGSFALFSVVAILISLATLPVVATRLPPPPVLSSPPLDLRRTFRAAPSAALGGLLSGLAMGSLWGLGAAYAAGSGFDRAGVGLFMSVTICGGAALQWPIGRASDRGDRRTTLALVSGTAAALATLAALPWFPLGGLLPLFFLYGGMAFALYPLCVAHLLDCLPADDLLSGCSTLLLLHGIGAAIGPALAGAAMSAAGPRALPAFFALVLAVLAAVAAGRRLLHARRWLPTRHFHPMLRTTPSALELLPEIPATATNGESP